MGEHARQLLARGYDEIEQGEPVDTSAPIPSEDARRKAEKFAMGSTISATKPRSK